jgi:hypothetical protein
MTGTRRSRDAGGSFTLNNPDDKTPIKEMLSIGKFLYLVTEKCTYRVHMADQVDPERNNPSLPHVFQQKLFDVGTESELLRRTFMQAKVLFRKEFLSIDTEMAMELTLEGLGELAALHDVCESFAASQQTAIEKAAASPTNDRSQTVPAIAGVQSRCKTFAQKADHFVVKLMEIARLFFPEQKGRNWDDFQRLANRLYGEGDSFSKLLEVVVPTLKLVRNTRDCLEHHLPGVTIRDFEPDPEGGIIPPTIEVDFRGTSVTRCSIASFMVHVRTHLLDTFEMLVAHMSAKHMQPFAGMPMSLGLLPENLQAVWHVRFAYGMYDQDGNFVPCG